MPKKELRVLGLAFAETEEHLKKCVGQTIPNTSEAFKEYGFLTPPIDMKDFLVMVDDRGQIIPNSVLEINDRLCPEAAPALGVLAAKDDCELA